jgi:hypothetical protein
MRSSLVALCLVIFIQVSFSQNWDTISVSQSQQQNTLQSLDNISSKSLKHIGDKYSNLTNAIQRQSEKLLQHMQQKEAKLQKKLQGIDTTKAKELFQESQAKYKELQIKMQSSVNIASAKLKEYIPGLDSINTAFKFLDQSKLNLSSLSSDKLKAIQNGSQRLTELQGKLQQSDEIQDFIRERESQLKTALQNTGLGKELLQLNKQVYYYQQQLIEYKAMLHDPDKMGAKALEILNKLPAFQSFWKKNSYLAQLFPMPNNYGTSEALAGLQTRASVQNILAQRIGNTRGTGTNPQQYLQQQMQQAQTQMNALKDKINQLGGGSSNMTMPDFQPNQQKTKSLFQRLQYGLNIQSQQGTSFLPALSDIALTVGYKLSDKKTFGIGASYKVGWGNGFKHIRFTSEGIGLRSYADIKAKGSIWITGGFEYNYLQRFNSFEQIKNIDVWQKSALAGLTKKYKIGKKKEGNVQLLYDFLHNQQVPQAQALKFRIGWGF